MLSTIITSTPIYVCSILSILLALSLSIKWDRARFRLLMFMITATMFYIGHFAFYNRTVSVMPVTDTLYCFSYPAIFPLILIYIEAMVENYYSNTEDKVVTFIKPLMIAFVATLTASFISNFLNRNYFTGSIWLLAIPALLFSSMILLFGFVGLTQNIYTRKIVEESAKMDAEEPEQAVIPLTPEKEHIMAAEIRRLMDEKRLFLQPNLKINDLAHMLNTNRNYIYNAINRGIGLSFAEYVNKKRIEYAVRLIDQNREILLTDVAIKSGFASTSAFYRNFKLYMDCTPSEYQKRGASITASLPSQ